MEKRVRQLAGEAQEAFEVARRLLVESASDRDQPTPVLDAEEKRSTLDQRRLSGHHDADDVEAAVALEQARRVGEVAADGGLLGRGEAEVAQPTWRPRAAARGVEHQVGGERRGRPRGVLDAYRGDPPVVDLEPGDADSGTHLDAGYPLEPAAQRPFEQHPALAVDVDAEIARLGLKEGAVVRAPVGQVGNQVPSDATDARAASPEIVGETREEARQDALTRDQQPVRMTGLRRRRPHREGVADGVALEHHDFAKVVGEHSRRRQTGDAAADHHRSIREGFSHHARVSHA